MDQRIPKLVQPTIENYIFLTRQSLPDLIEGFYIVGSIALDEFNERFSDIDFIAVLKRGITTEEIDQLRNIHQIIEKKHPRWKMSGNYIQVNDLGKWNSIGLHPHFHDGGLYFDAHNELNSITWWELKNHGIPVLGTEPPQLNFTVDWNLLIKEMHENLNSYWRAWTIHPRRIVVLFSDGGIQWAVLGVLRQFYTFKESSITTKIRAAEYALGFLPTRWHPLIREAIHIRTGKKISFRLKFVRAIEAMKFLNYIISVCNTDTLT